MLLKIQNKDLDKCLTYFLSDKITQEELDQNKSLIRISHSIAFTMSTFVQRLTKIPDWVVPYLNILNSDSIQVFTSVITGTKRTLHLYERACIEDLLRYVYFFDHPIEQILFNKTKKYLSIDEMIKWLEEYPTLTSIHEIVVDNCSKLQSRYSDLSRTVHGTTLDDHQIIKSITESANCKFDAGKEGDVMKGVFKPIFFLLAAFHINDYRKLNLDEKTLYCQYLDDKQIKLLSGLTG